MKKSWKLAIKSANEQFADNQTAGIETWPHKRILCANFPCCCESINLWTYSPISAISKWNIRSKWSKIYLKWHRKFVYFSAYIRWWRWGHERMRITRWNTQIYIIDIIKCWIGLGKERKKSRSYFSHSFLLLRLLVPHRKAK